jgi:hypothetical protein
MSTITHDQFVDSLITESFREGALGSKDALTKLNSEAIAAGFRAPLPVSVISLLRTTKKRDKTEQAYGPARTFVYAFYLMREYGYDAGDARRIASNLGTELDTMFSTDVAATKVAITEAEDALYEARQDNRLPKKVGTIINAVDDLKTLLKSQHLSDDDAQALASALEDARILITAPSAVEALV